MGRRRVALVAVAVVLGAADLAVEASDPVYGDPRGTPFAIGALALVAAVVAAVPRVPSLQLSLAGGVAVAGALGNLVSALAFAGGVPNPLVTGGVAFNPADVFALAGSAWLVAGAALFALHNRGLLREPL